MLAFEVFIIHLSSASREGTCSVPLNYQILFLPATMRQEANNMGDPEKREGGVAVVRGGGIEREKEKEGGIA